MTESGINEVERLRFWQVTEDGRQDGSRKHADYKPANFREIPIKGAKCMI